jgi:putative flavoprotein involved in K+ transport
MSSTPFDVAAIAKAVATRLGLPAKDLEIYRKSGMYLDDLSCS